MTQPKTWQEQMAAAGATLPEYVPPKIFAQEQKLKFILDYIIATRQCGTIDGVQRQVICHIAAELFDKAVAASKGV